VSEWSDMYTHGLLFLTKRVDLIDFLSWLSYMYTHAELMVCVTVNMLAPGAVVRKFEPRRFTLKSIKLVFVVYPLSP